METHLLESRLHLYPNLPRSANILMAGQFIIWTNRSCGYSGGRLKSVLNRCVQLGKEFLLSAKMNSTSKRKVKPFEKVVDDSSFS